MTGQHDRATLRYLLKIHRQQTGDSYAAIAKKTGLSKALIGQLFNTTGSHLATRSTVEKLARGLELPMHVVERAALETGQIDYRAPERHAAREALLLNRYTSLTPELQEALIEIAGTLGRLPRPIGERG